MLRERARRARLHLGEMLFRAGLWLLDPADAEAATSDRSDVVREAAPTPRVGAEPNAHARAMMAEAHERAPLSAPEPRRALKGSIADRFDGDR